MKICHLISGDLWAGAEVMVFRLLKGLITYDDQEVSAILFNEGRLSEELRNLGIPHFIADEKKLKSMQVLGEIKNILREISPDVLHSHRYKENILAYLSVRSLDNNISLVSTQHGMPELLNLKQKVLKHRILLKLDRWGLKRYFDHVVVVSRDLRDHFVEKWHFPERKVKLIYNGTEIPENKTAKRDKFVIGSAGRFFPVKDYPLLVEVARELLDRTDRIRFELAGDGPEKGRIEEQVREYGLEDRFVLRGFIDDMDSFYRGLDLYINTSHHEGNPMSVLEAMAHGLPVIAPGRGGLNEFLGYEKGSVINSRNPGDYADRCLKLSENR